MEDKKNEQVQIEKNAPDWKRDLMFLLIKIGTTLIAGYLVLTFVFGFTRAQDMSMHPHIKDGDLILFYRLNKEYLAEDVIVYKESVKEMPAETYVGRVVARSGEVVDIPEDGSVTVNGNRVFQDVYYETYQHNTEVTFPLLVKEGEVFVLGDGRENCLDSRDFGAIPKEKIKGKVISILRRRSL